MSDEKNVDCSSSDDEDEAKLLDEEDEQIKKKSDISILENIKKILDPIAEVNPYKYDIYEKEGRFYLLCDYFINLAGLRWDSRKYAKKNSIHTLVGFDGNIYVDRYGILHILLTREWSKNVIDKITDCIRKEETRDCPYSDNACIEVLNSKKRASKGKYYLMRSIKSVESDKYIWSLEMNLPPFPINEYYNTNPLDNMEMIKDFMEEDKRNATDSNEKLWKIFSDYFERESGLASDLCHVNYILYGTLMLTKKQRNSLSFILNNTYSLTESFLKSYMNVNLGTKLA